MLSSTAAWARGTLEEPIGVHQFSDHVIFGFVVGHEEFAPENFDGLMILDAFVLQDERVRGAAAMLVSGPPIEILLRNISWIPRRDCLACI